MNTPPTSSASGRLRAALLVLLVIVVVLWVVLSRGTRNGAPQLTVRTPTSTLDRVRTTAEPSVSVPDDFPADMPLYPDARVSTVHQRTRSSPYTLELVVQDDVATIRTRYERLLRQSAWVLQSVSDDTGVHITLRKGSRSATILLEAAAERTGATRILVTVPPSSGGAAG